MFLFVQSLSFSIQPPKNLSIPSSIIRDALHRVVTAITDQKRSLNNSTSSVDARSTLVQVHRRHSQIHNHINLCLLIPTCLCNWCVFFLLLQFHVLCFFCWMSQILICLQFLIQFFQKRVVPNLNLSPIFNSIFPEKDLFHCNFFLFCYKVFMPLLAYFHFFSTIYILKIVSFRKWFQ